MSFFKEIAEALGLEWTKLSAGYQVINYNGEAVYIEGVKRVISIDKELIALQLSKAEIEIEGDGLNIFDITGAAVMIKGFIIGYKIKNAQSGSGGYLEDKKLEK